MFNPPIEPGVRASDSSGESIVPGIHPPANAVSIHSQHLRRTIEGAMQQPPFSKGDGVNPALSGSIHEQSVTASLHCLHAAHVQIRRSFLLLADLHDLLRTTMDAVRKSQELIANSDRVILRGQTLGCQETLNGRAG